jgi:hypothetical protein
MGDDSEAVMAVKVHPVILQVIDKHCILHLFMKKMIASPQL